MIEKGIAINQSLTTEQVAKVNVQIFFKVNLKYWIILIFCSAFIFITNTFNPLNLYNKSDFDIASFTFLVIVLLFPILLNYSFKKRLKKESRFHSNIEYIFDNENIKIQGENFNVSNNWKEILEKKETKDWLFLYRSKNQAIIIDKNQQKPETIKEIKKLFNPLNIKKSLL